MSMDENVLAVRKARQALIRRYGGLDGWIRHLQALDRRRRGAQKRTPRHRSVAESK
jgi:hypothetical protein